MAQYDRKVLNHLLDAYENSLLSTGENKRNIQIEFRFTKTSIPSYFDESSDEYERVHILMKLLESKELIRIIWKDNKQDYMIRKVRLMADHIEEVYQYVGRKPKRGLEEENITEIKSYIHAPGYIANTDLVALYCGAFAFLYPSLRESFGIPMLEAMACGTPIIAGNTSAMPEIAGEGALLADPFNSNDITKKILQLENDQTLYQQQVEYGIQRSQLFSWRNTAESLLKIYKEFAK